MLRNSYFDQYQNLINKDSMEKELLLYQNDLNRFIYSQRPMSTSLIRKLPEKVLPAFIDDIMCDNEINTLLYSSNAHKEINFYLKQKESLLYKNINPKSPPKKKNILMSNNNQSFLLVYNDYYFLLCFCMDIILL